MMLIKSKFKREDNVIVMSGSHKGLSGTVLKVLLNESKLIVSGVNLRKRRTKSSKKTFGDNNMVEYPIHQSNVMHLDPKTSLPTKIGYKIIKDGDNSKKVRYARKSGELIDVV